MIDCILVYSSQYGPFYFYHYNLFLSTHFNMEKYR